MQATKVLCLGLCAIILSACNATRYDLSDEASELFSTVRQTDAASPPTYVRVKPAKLHPDFAIEIDPLHLPKVDIQTAITTSFPFAVNVRIGEGVDKTARYTVRIVNQMTLVQFLQQMESITGYRITYLPTERTVEVSGLVTQSWYFPTLVGRHQTQVNLGNDVGISSAPTDDQGSAVDQQAMRTQYDTRRNLEWNELVNQVYCAAASPMCGKLGAFSLAGGGSSEAGSRSKDGSWVVVNRDQGIITVTAKPKTIEALNQWLSKLQDSLARFIKLQIALLSIRKDAVDQRGINISALLRKRLSREGVLTGAAASIGLQHGFDSRPGGVLVLSGEITRGRFTLSEMIRFIKEDIESEVLHEATLLLSSGETSTIRSTESFYFASGSNFVSATANSSERVATELEQREVVVELAITPRFLNPDSDIMSIRIIPMISRLSRLEDIVSDGRIVSRAPYIEKSNFSAHALVRDSQAAVIGGLTMKTARRSKRDLPFSLPLGSKEDSVSESELVVIVLAQEMEA